ncbi:MAG TPA: efflux RND transporter permease subunit [Candidatus Binataceae bacterium]|nr:efflux RND transporter permease subunit [Candidatus Binataceae bacterium]
MNISALFIERPVATALLAIAILLAGALAYSRLPVAPLPNITFPMVVVQATMAGAAPEIMAATVAEPLEKRLKIIAGVTELSSMSFVGQTRIVAQFDVSRDINGAARDVQAAIQAARADLPTTLQSNPTWRQYNPADSPIMILALTSKTLTMAQLYDSADTVIQQQLSQVGGVGQITLGGAALPSVRIELEPDKLNSYGIGMEDVRAAVSAANADSAKGYIDQSDQRFEVFSNDEATVAADYRNLIIAYRQNSPVMLHDVAEVIDSNQNIRNIGLYNGQPAVGVIVYPIPGANIVATNARIRKLLPSVQAALPHHIHISIAMDRSQSVNAAVEDTERSLVIAVVLVIGVVFIFLQSMRSTAIPAVALPLSIIGTFAPMYLLGYSIDNLSLMALTIGTGFVVDDAVVVLENIARHIESGLSPHEAALQGSAEVGFTVISMSLSLIAVFIPVLLMPGVIGLLLHEFAVTLSIAILISMVISLTVTPCMCARLLKSLDAPQTRARWAVWLESQFDRFKDAYGRGLWLVLHRSLLIGLVLVGLIVGNVFLFRLLPSTLFPEQDNGFILGQIIADQDISFPAMAQKLSQLQGIVSKDPAVASVFGFTGSGSAGRAGNQANIYIALKPLSQRDLAADQIVQRLRPSLNRVSGARMFLQAQQDLHIGGQQSAAEYQYTLNGDDPQAIYKVVPSLITELRKHPDQLTDVNTDMQQNGLQTYVTIDRATAARYQLTPNQIDQVLYDAFGQRTVSTIYNPFNQYFVVMEVAPKYWQHPRELNRIFVSTAAGNVTGTASTQMPPGTVSSIAAFSSLVAPQTTASATNSLNSLAQAAESNENTNTISNGRGGTSTANADSTTPETMVPMAALASSVNTHTAIQVNHLGGLVSATVSFNLPPGGSLSDAQTLIESTMRELDAPASIHGSFQGAAKVFAQSFNAIPVLILAALIAVYIVLGILYENTIHPLTIISTLPSAGIGATLALLIFGVPFSVIALIGIILLIGIVKKNAIMMIDFAIHLERNEKREPSDAIHEAAVIRLRPIMMTTAAAVLGAVPLAIGIGMGASVRQPLGITMMGGLVLSQIFTLFTTPVIYLSFERLRLNLISLGSGLFRRRRGETGSSA